MKTLTMNPWEIVWVSLRFLLYLHLFFFIYNLSTMHRPPLLDYTDKPSMNVLPGDVNMDKLSDMYLSRRSRRVEKDGTVVETTELVKR